jgi:large subunit ribosomal protein L1
MGKMKTSFVGGVDEQPVKPSYDKAAKEAKRRAREGFDEKKEEVKKQNKPEVKVSQKETTVSYEETQGAQETSNVTEAKEIKETSEQKSSTSEKSAKVRGQKHLNAKAKVDRTRLYLISEAIALVKEISYTKFDATLELHMVVKKEGTNVSLTLPHPFGKQKKVVVADEKVIEELKAGKINFDVLLATADMMPKLVQFARLLGPRGLMPNPKNGTLIKTAKDAEKYAGNTVALKTEKKAPVIHTSVGKVSQSDSEITANISAVVEALGPRQILRAYISSTMGPSVKLSL